MNESLPPPPSPPADAPIPVTAAVAEAPPRRARTLWLILGGLLLALIGGGVAWRYYVTRPDYRFRQGRRAIEAGKWMRAWEMAELLEDAGQGERAELLRGEALMAQGEFASALDRFNRIRDDDALRLQAGFHSGRCLLELGQHAEANRVLLWALDQDPDNVDGHRAMAAVAYDLGQMGRARHHLDRCAELAPNDGRSYRLRGLIAKFAADYDTALASYQDALERDLSVHFRREVLLEMAEIYADQKKPDELLAALDRMDALGGEAPAQGAALRAGALRHKNKPAEAWQVIERALERHPNEPDLWLLKGEALLLTDRNPKQAALALEQAAKLRPKDYRTQHLLSLAYTGSGQADKARPAAAAAEVMRKLKIRLDDLSRQAMARPLDAQVRQELGDLWRHEMNNPKMAAMWYRAAAALKAE